MRFKQFVEKLPNDPKQLDSKRAEIDCDRALAQSADFRANVEQHAKLARRDSAATAGNSAID